MITKGGKNNEKSHHRKIRGERELKDTNHGLTSQRRQERVKSRAPVEG